MSDEKEECKCPPVGLLGFSVKVDFSELLHRRAVF